MTLNRKKNKVEKDSNITSSTNQVVSETEDMEKINKNSNLCSSLPNNLDIPDIVPARYDTETAEDIEQNEYNKASNELDNNSKHMYMNNYRKMDPIWLQMASNGMAILPCNIHKHSLMNGISSKLPRLMTPQEFITPNVGIVTTTKNGTGRVLGSNINGSNRVVTRISIDKHKDKDKAKGICRTLFTKNVNVGFEGEGKGIDWNHDLFIVDLSYMTYKRFFATRTWYNIAFADRKVEGDHDWCKDTDFMAKFRKLFLKNLVAQAKSRNVPVQNIVFAIDCRHVDNWRVVSSNTYKSTRKESHVKNNFHNFDVFPIVRNELIAEMQNQTGNMMFVHKNLEADDVIALMIKYIRKRKPTYNGSIFIVANDRDYIQICGDKTILIDLDGKAISNLALADGKNAGDYLLAKILIGDCSDNIPPCYFNKDFLANAGIHIKRPYLKCTPSIVQQVMENMDTKQKLIGMMDKCRLRILDSCIQYTAEELTITKNNQLDYNARHMDFEHIPSKYATEINIVFMQCFGF